jgi:hypothetical protein
MNLIEKGANMDYHSNIHRQLVKERQQESAKEQRERKRELDRDRSEFIASGIPVAMPQSQVRFLKGNKA